MTEKNGPTLPQSLDRDLVIRAGVPLDEALRVLSRVLDPSGAWGADSGLVVYRLGENGGIGVRRTVAAYTVSAYAAIRPEVTEC